MKANFDDWVIKVSLSFTAAMHSLKHFDNGNAVPMHSGSFPTMGTASPLESTPVEMSTGYTAIQIQPTFFISDIRPLWCAALSAIVAKCQKLKVQVRSG